MPSSLTLSPLQTAVEALESLVSVGRRYRGLWPSCMSLDGARVWSTLAEIPQAIPGQRDCDRSPGGCNLMHDMAALGTAYSLGEVLGHKDLAQAADTYLQYYLARASQNETGLFPWGEHAWIDLATGGMGDGYLVPVYKGVNPEWWDGLPRPVWHDHLRQAPAWFWQKAGAMYPTAVQRFADGLDRQWKTDDRDEYNRHGAVSRNMRHGIRPGSRSCDFPRHSGFYIFDLACAYAQEPRQETMVQLWRYSDHWWNRRQAGHCLPCESRPDPAETGLLNTCQTLSLAASLYESAEVLRAIDLPASAELRRRALALAEWTLNAPHDLPGGKFAVLYRAGEAEPVLYHTFFGSVYGQAPTSSLALLNCAFYRWGAGERFLQLALAMGLQCRREIEAGIFGKGGENGAGVNIPALDAGLAIDLLCELFAITQDRSWLESAAALWEAASREYFPGALPRLASGADWYEAQQGSAYLIHAAARLGLLLESEGKCDLGVDTTAR